MSKKFALASRVPHVRYYKILFCVKLRYYNLVCTV